MAGFNSRKSGSNVGPVARRHYAARTADTGTDAHYCDRVVAAIRCDGEVDDGGLLDAGSPRCGCGWEASQVFGISTWYQSEVVTRLRAGGSSSTAAEAGGEKWDVLSLPAEAGGIIDPSGSKAHIGNLDFRLTGVLRSNRFEPKGVLSRCQTFPSQTFLAGLDLEGWC